MIGDGEPPITTVDVLPEEPIDGALSVVPEAPVKLTPEPPIEGAPEPPIDAPVALRGLKVTVGGPSATVVMTEINPLYISLHSTLENPMTGCYDKHIAVAVHKARVVLKYKIDRRGTVSESKVVRSTDRSDSFWTWTASGYHWRSAQNRTVLWLASRRKDTRVG
ncbi:MAG: hypothetical protein ACI9MC_004028 [Kiritimatiellia bacterium]